MENRESSQDPYRAPEAEGYIDESADRRIPPRRTRLLGSILDGLFELAVWSPSLVWIGDELKSVEWDESRLRPESRLIYWAFVLLSFAIQSVVLAARSQSIGKVLVGTKIVSHPDGSNPGLIRMVILRLWVQYLVLGMIPYFGRFYIWVDALAIFFSKENRCIHDLLAGTIVVYVDNESRTEIDS
jgi:uncharacterized RDD family membrane protein YckC